METVTMQCSYDLILCPVRAWARIISRIISNWGGSENTFVSQYRIKGDDKGSFLEVTSKDMAGALRAAASSYGLDRLGFQSTDIGTHSIRSGAAMAMYLDKVPVYTIMLIGRWSSDAFLQYIRKQVEQFSHNVSRQMIKNQHFTHIPHNRSTSRLDPLQRNHRDNAQTRRNMGGAAVRVLQTLPTMAQW